jgi:hypothetical protein
VAVLPISNAEFVSKVIEHLLGLAVFVVEKFLHMFAVKLQGNTARERASSRIWSVQASEGGILEGLRKSMIESA